MTHEFDEDEIKEMRDLAFSSEINFLSIHILLEAFHRGENILTLGDFIKGDYWKVDEIYESIRENHDYNSVPDLVLEQLRITVTVFGIGEIKNVSVVTLSLLLEDVIKDALETEVGDNDLEEMVNHFSAVVSKIGELTALSEERKKKAFEDGQYSTEKWSHYYDRIDFTPEEYSKHLEYILHVAAPFVELEVDFYKEGAEKIEKAIKDYLVAFSQDEFLDKRENRLYFSKQLENFLAYINKLPVIDGYVNVPFDVLRETGFEFVKIVSYLEEKGKLKIRNWGDKNVWNIKFHTTPITIVSLVSSSQAEKAPVEIASLKSDLSFSEEKGVLKIGEKEAFFRKDTMPFHLVRIIFEDRAELDKEWFFSEIGEKFDSSATFDDKKFANAAYQAKIRIIRDTGIKDFFITTKHSVTINPKYLG